MKTIWVDGDGCSREARRVLFRLAAKGRVDVLLIANRLLRMTENTHVKTIVVGSEEGATDHYIFHHATADDIVITRDVTLAKQLLAQNVQVLSDRGRVFSADNIQYHFSLRNIAEEVRSWQPGHARSSRKKQKFSHSFAREVEKCLDT